MPRPRGGNGFQGVRHARLLGLTDLTFVHAEGRGISPSASEACAARAGRSAELVPERGRLERFHFSSNHESALDS
jgi:hypothetical protein